MNIISIDLPWNPAKSGRRALAIADLNRNIKIVAAGASEIVTFSVSKAAVGSYNVTVDGLTASFTVVAPALPEEEEVVPAAINWPLIGGIIGGVVVVGLLGFFFLRRRRVA